MSVTEGRGPQRKERLLRALRTHLLSSPSASRRYRTTTSHSAGSLI